MFSIEYICIYFFRRSDNNNKNNNNDNNDKESEKKDKYLDLARELKKLEHEGDDYTIVIGAFGTVAKGLLKGLEDLEVGGRMETTQTAALLRNARTLRRVLET